MARASSKKKSGCGAAGCFSLLVLILLLGGAAVAWFVFAPASPSTETFIDIAPGSSTRQIATELEHAGIVRSRYAFEAMRFLLPGSLKAGEYRFDHPAPVRDVYSRIAKGDVFTLPVTIPEGATRFDIAARLEEAGLVKKDAFLTATLNYPDLIRDLDPHAKSLEGYLFPDTYRFQRRATALQVVTAMVHRFRAVAAEIGLTPAANHNVHNIVTLASLVERETAVDSERPLVASVLTNRLGKDMPLMTDPAVIYGLQVQGLWRGAIYQSDLARDTPYNTYRHPGLPPGPIANPGIRSLKAALNPAPTNYLYFVAAGADPQGKSRFAATLEEHNKNVESYRSAVKQAGGH